MIGDSVDEINFTHKLLLTDTQVSRLRKDFANNLSANIKLSKTQQSKIVQLGGILPLLGLTLTAALNARAEVAKHSAK